MFFAKVYSELRVVYHIHYTSHQQQQKWEGGGGGALPCSILMLSIVIFTYMKNMTVPSYYRV